MSDEMLNRVIHQLTHRRFKDTPRETAYQQGSTISNSFYDPRNIGNFQNGEIVPEGTFANRYPTNVASNTMGFSIMDDMGNDKRQYFPSVISSNVNALVKGGGTSPSSGSSSDYMYFNKSYEALLNPHSHQEMEDIIDPFYNPVSYSNNIEGRGTNAPSGASNIDYAMNNPYAVKSNFNGFTGGALGASSAGSSSDYYDSNPYRVPGMQSENVDFSQFMEGGKVNWGKYFKYIKSGVKTVYKHVAPVLKEVAKEALPIVIKEYAVPYLEKHGPKIVRETAKHLPLAIEKLQELRNNLKKEKEAKAKEKEEKKEGKGHRKNHKKINIKNKY